MPDERTTNGRKSANDAFGELRALLVGPEREKIQQLQDRLDDPVARAEEIRRALPDAIRQAGRSHKLRLVLQPIIEDGIRISVQRDPAILADALSPLIGETVRKAVSSALQSMLQTLNQVLEQSLSLRSVRWRWEALRTGRSFAEIVLLRSMLYRVEQVFLIHRKTGLLLAHSAVDDAVVKDADLVSGMLTAIQDFVQDSFGGGQGQQLDTLQVGEYAVWIQYGTQVLLACVIRGAPPKALSSVFESALERISAEHGVNLGTFDGDASPFHSAKKHLRACILGQAPGQPQQSMLLWLVPSFLALAASFWLFTSVRENLQWNQYIQKLGQEPGIVITHTERRSGKYHISGLRDPMAHDPGALLQSAGFPSDRVSFQWQEYLSNDEPFAALRELRAATNRVEAKRIHFRPDSAQIALEQLESVDNAAGEIQQLFVIAKRAGKSLRIEIVGHTDDSGTEARNAQLSEERAVGAKVALVSAGVPADRFSSRGVATTEPLSKGSSENDRAFNRSVTLRVLSEE